MKRLSLITLFVLLSIACTLPGKPSTPKGAENNKPVQSGLFGDPDSVTLNCRDTDQYSLMFHSARTIDPTDSGGTYTRIKVEYGNQPPTEYQAVLGKDGQQYTAEWKLSENDIIAGASANKFYVTFVHRGLERKFLVASTFPFQNISQVDHRPCNQQISFIDGTYLTGQLGYAFLFIYGLIFLVYFLLGLGMRKVIGISEMDFRLDYPEKYKTIQTINIYFATLLLSVIIIGFIFVIAYNFVLAAMITFSGFSLLANGVREGYIEVSLRTFTSRSKEHKLVYYFDEDNQLWHRAFIKLIVSTLLLAACILGLIVIIT
jgi:hypothetical protein